MPFTVAHTAAVLPFSRYLNRAHLLSATVIGSMAPDFGVFLPWALLRGQTHGLHPMISFCLPLGLLAYWLFQYLIKPPLFELLPDSTWQRWNDHRPPASIWRISQWLLASVGILIGTLSHLSWDAFTHEGARGVRWFPDLEETNVDIAGHHYYGFSALQVASSIVGLLIVAGFLVYTLRPAEVAPEVPARALSPGQRRRWLRGILFSTLLLTVGLALLDKDADFQWSRMDDIVGGTAVAALRATAIIVIGAAGLVRLRMRDFRNAASESA